MALFSFILACETCPTTISREVQSRDVVFSGGDALRKADFNKKTVDNIAVGDTVCFFSGVSEKYQYAKTNNTLITVKKYSYETIPCGKQASGEPHLVTNKFIYSIAGIPIIGSVDAGGVRGGAKNLIIKKKDDGSLWHGSHQLPGDTIGLTYCVDIRNEGSGPAKRIVLVDGLPKDYEVTGITISSVPNVTKKARSLAWEIKEKQGIKFLICNFDLGDSPLQPVGALQPIMQVIIEGHINAAALK